MDPMLPTKPAAASRYGFENAPISKFLLIASGAATFNLFFLPSKCQGLLNLNWPRIISQKEVWRLLTSQIVYDSTGEFLYGSALIYNFRTLERQWGSKKFASFILATCSLTLGTHLMCHNSDFIQSYIPIDETMSGGLYGPIFAFLFFFIRDIHSSPFLVQNGFSLSNKWMVYLIAFRMLFTNNRSKVAGVFGMLSGLLYGWNFMYIKHWLCVPDFVSKFTCSIYNWFRIEDDGKPKCKKTYAGATEDIHEDMMYDYMLRLQAESQRIAGDPRQQVGQGYADTLQPAVDPIQGFFDQNPPEANGWQNNLQPQQDNTAGPSSANESLPDDKIQRLIEMGFTREAVIGALENTGNNIQEATNVLLSQ